MQRNDDPRNIFYNQRQEFSQSPTQNQSAQQQAGGDSFGSGGTPNGQKTAEPSGTSTDKTYEEKVRQMKELAAKYERAGEGQLVRDIVNNVIEQKAAGTLSNDQLIAFAKRISPLLNAEQRTRLNGLLQELLKI